MPPDRPPIFVYVIDTLRADALEIYGSDRAETPHLRRLARDAVTFERAWSAAPWTLPSTVSLLSGLMPRRHGYVRADVRRSPRGEERRLPDLLKPLGYEAVGVSQSWVVSDLYGLDRGFDHFYTSDVLGTRRQESENVRRLLWSHLLGRERADEPLLAYLHTVAPHRPYVAENPRLRTWSRWQSLTDLFDRSRKRSRRPAKDPRRVEHDRTPYDAEVAYADRQLGAFLAMLEYLGLYDQSLIVVTSDHGEEFLEHGGLHHLHTLYEELLRVPLLIKLPGSRHGGTRSPHPASGLDIVPTILAALGRTEESGQFDGESLLPALEGRAEPRRRLVAETSPGDGGMRFPRLDLRAIGLGNLKCIHNVHRIDRRFEEVAEFRSFDLAADPGERRPLPPSDPRAERCREMLLRLTERFDALGDPLDEDLGVSAEERARLEALGYL